MARIIVEIAGKDAGATATMAKVTDASAKLGAQSVKTSAILGGATVKASNSAAFALTNLGRVAQDAPFGFIGIQNNLNPLLESFQQLKQESGSTVTALKAMGASLIGPAGLGIALSVVTAAFTFYTQWQQKAARETEEATKVNENYAESIDRVDQAQIKGAQDAQAALVPIRTLYNATQDLTLSNEQRVRAANKLRELAPITFKDLSTEAILAGDAADAYKKLADNILLIASYKANEDALIANLKEQAELQVRVERAIAIRSNTERSAQIQRALLAADSAEEVAALNKELQQLSSSGVGNLFSKSTAQALKDIPMILNFQGNLNELKKEEETITSRIRAGQPDNIEETGKKENDILERRKQLLKDLQAAKQEFYLTLIEQQRQLLLNDDAVIDGFAQKYTDTLKDLVEKSKQFEPVKIETVYPDTTEAQEKAARDYIKALDNAQRFSEALGQTIGSGFSSGLSNIGASIGQALAQGSDVFSAVGAGILSSFGEILKQLGEVAIKTGIGIAAIKLSLKTLNPAVAIAAGIALVTFGSLIASSVSKIGSDFDQTQSTRRIPGFANGVTNFRGGTALVGERGPELVYLPKGSDVIPNHKIASGGGMGDGLIAEARISLRDLVLAVRREESLNRRTG